MAMELTYEAAEADPLAAMTGSVPSRGLKLTPTSPLLWRTKKTRPEPSAARLYHTLSSLRNRVISAVVGLMLTSDGVLSAGHAARPKSLALTGS